MVNASYEPVEESAAPRQPDRRLIISFIIHATGLLLLPGSRFYYYNEQKFINCGRSDT